MSGTRLKILIQHKGETMREQQKRVYIRLDKKISEMTEEELLEYVKSWREEVTKRLRPEENG